MEGGLAHNSACLSEGEFHRLGLFIQSECGIKMPTVKKSMLESRLKKRLRSLGMGTFREYCDYLFSREGIRDETVNMLDVVTTNKTDFFREPKHFQYLLETALPTLAAPGLGPLRVWSAGCSTGEEPYTLAMVLSEFREGLQWFDFSILATDISTQALEKSRAAVYEALKAEAVPLELKKKYLLRSKDRSLGLVRVAPYLRAKVRFRRLNLMDGDFGIGEPVDVIFFRNVMIYFDRPTQEMVLDRLCRSLIKGGYLFTGHSETLHGMKLPISQVAPTVYRRNP